MSHYHHHDPACECKPQAPYEPQDAAGMSLTSALRTSFVILKIIMLVLVVLFLTSGIFRVQPDEQALILRFGEIQGLGDARVKNPGLKFTWPEPICEVVRIPVKKIQTLNVDSFWYFETEAEKLGQKNLYPPPTLDPIKDGYCLTRDEGLGGMEGIDYNIVHSRWSITYSIDQPERFFENIYYEQPKPGENFLEAADKTVRPLLESFVSNAIVSTMVHYNIDDAVTSKTDISEGVKRRLQEKLDAVGSGIRIDDVRADRIVWPRQVDSAFQASNEASQQSKTAITEASAYKDKLLTDTAGPLAEQLLEKLKQSGLTQQQKEELVAQMKGQVQGLISDARAYKTTVVEEAKSNADYLLKLLPEYKKRPDLVLQRLYQDYIEQIMAAADEKIMIQPATTQNGKELRVLINRDPKVQKKQTPEQK